MNRRLLLGIAAGGVLLIATGGTVVVLAARDRPDTFGLPKEPYETGSPTPTASVSSFSLPPLLTDFPTAPTSAPPTSAAPAPSPTPVASATTTRPVPTSPAAATPSYRPNAARAIPTCDASFAAACAYPNAKAPVTNGVRDLRCTLTGAATIRVSWDSDHFGWQGGTPPVDAFVVRLWRHPDGSTANSPDMRDKTRLYQVRATRDTAAVTVSSLVRGARYACFVQELNAGGLSAAGTVLNVTTQAPSPTPTPTPSPSATPTPTPSETPTPTPTP